MKTIEITILPDGQTKIQTRGFSGNACRAASRFWEATLGHAMSETLTTEFHATQTEQHSQLRRDDN
jgi:hypothetical protein